MDKSIPIAYDVYLCSACASISGQGERVEIRYGNTGGYSPLWEGRYCEHLTPKEVLQYIEQDEDKE